MPDHKIVKAEAWASAALGLLHRDIVLAGLVQRDTGANFTGAANDTLNIRRPSRLAAVNEALRDMDESDYEIESESLNESSIAVTLDRHVYSAVDLSDAQLSLDIADFGAQVLNPQARAVATRLEFMVAEAMNGLDAEEITVSGDDGVRNAIVKLRRKLNENDVPNDGRVLVVGVDVEEKLLRDKHLTQVDQSGSDSALRNAEVARLLGFRIVVSNTVDADRMVAFHPTAWTLVTRAPIVPASVGDGRSESYEGFSLRAIRDYNSRVAQDRSLISTFAGLGQTTDKTVTYSEGGKPTISDEYSMVRAVAATISEEEPEPDPSP